ncbi:Divalent-cation tolerance protein CutA [Tepidimonas alkaliphilus]|uniref:Divalent-cation tolerance protein CutA n=1 Tax=Tepidimonas alkaliphilus TaxID=2588942 RepID=A0A554W572_9BURK|nr:divalent-cation tolerance protein CutA [Tepidimonas alkaliphilus]TSE18721.1 Divalent-cation tolerance protein CutA [Tepidimonas alkaliphilus]
MASDLIAVMTTLPDEASAQALAEHLVHHRWAACVQWHAIDSVYEWHGRLQCDREWRLLAKCRRADWTAVCDAIRAQHPYELPAIWCSPIETSEAYGDWVKQQTERPEAS